MNPKGGSELVYLNILKYVKNVDKINLMLSTCSPDHISKDRPDILLQELSYDQQNVQLMGDSDFTKKIDHFVFVSHWQYEKFRSIFNVDINKSSIIRNAIDPIKYSPRKKTDKLKLIYTSTPWRGLNVLLKAFELLDRDDIELHVYSSVIIYGDSFAKETQARYEPLFQKARDMKNVVYHGYADNEEIREALTEAHIFAYPNTFEETSCISAIEAGAAGCKMLCTNYGALPETCSGFAEFVPYTSNYRKLAALFSEKLNIVIDNYWGIDTQDKLKRQSDYFNHNYCWEMVAQEWEELINKLSLSIAKEANTPKYWDTVYREEAKHPNFWIRKDVIGWKYISDRINPGDKILDFGCGTGGFLVEIKKYVDSIIRCGVDHSQVALDLMHKSDKRITSFTSLDELHSAEVFDVICALHVIEHFKKPKEIIERLKGYLKDKGMMIISIPIKDQEFAEHHKIWNISDFIELLNTFDCTYRIWYRDTVIRPKEVTGLKEDKILEHPSGTKWKEAMAFIHFS